MKILVTGGAGYIGSHTVVELFNAGFTPIIVDDLSNSKVSVLDAIEKIVGKRPAFYETDLQNIDLLRSIFSENSINAIVHFAASKAVGESVQKPLMYYRNNLLSTLNLLECMKENKIESLIFSSSCTVYGEPDVLPVTEKTVIKKANSPYGNTKQICEEIIQDTTSALSGLNAISLRYFNPIGAHSSGLIGEYPQDAPNNLMPYLLKVVFGELEKLSVFGMDYNTPDGTCIRDYIHVVDLAKAHVKALERLESRNNKTQHEYFNIGTGNGYSVLQLIEAFEDTVRKKVNYEVVGRRAGDVEMIFADPTLANQELNWKAELGIDEMVKSAYDWYTSFTRN